MPLWWVEHGHKDRCGFFFRNKCVCGEFFRGIFQLLVVVEFESFKLLVLMGSHMRKFSPRKKRCACLLACLCVCVWCCCFYASRHKQFCGFFREERTFFSESVFSCCAGKVGILCWVMFWVFTLRRMSAIYSRVLFINFNFQIFNTENSSTRN